MRSIIFLAIFGISSYSEITAQTTYVGQSSNTWYVTAPTAGCNGVWALDKTQWPCNTTVYSYSMNPWGCATSPCGPEVNDTVFLTLCSLPCNITLATTDGPVLICGTGTPTTTGIAESHTLGELNIYPNPANKAVIFETNYAQGEDVIIQVFDLSGKLIQFRNLSKGNTKMQFDVSSLSAGDYIVNVMVKEKLFLSKKLTVTGK